MSEHRGHLLPDAEDISCRGGLIVGLRTGMRQRSLPVAEIVTCSPVMPGCRQARSAATRYPAGRLQEAR